MFGKKIHQFVRTETGASHATEVNRAYTNGYVNTNGLDSWLEGYMIGGDTPVDISSRFASSNARINKTVEQRHVSL